MLALVDTWRKILSRRCYTQKCGTTHSAEVLEARHRKRSAHLSAMGGPVQSGQEPLDQPRRALGQQRDCDVVPGSAARAKRISAESECEPVFFMTAARWFSTVRWLMPRSAAMFLLGWPASTSFMIWRWRTVRPARRVAAASR